MKSLPKQVALEKLRSLKEDFRDRIRTGYEFRARDCETCDVKGSCCTDAHFVNVHISRLEAEEIADIVSTLSAPVRERVIGRTREVAHGFETRVEDSFATTYSCPLFESGMGCVAHKRGKPAPCINHACYESESDLPPDEVLEKVEKEVGRLNDRVYGNGWNWLPIPVWLEKVLDK